MNHQSIFHLMLQNCNLWISNQWESLLFTLWNPSFLAWSVVSTNCTLTVRKICFFFHPNQWIEVYKTRSTWYLPSIIFLNLSFRISWLYDFNLWLAKDVFNSYIFSFHGCNLWNADSDYLFWWFWDYFPRQTFYFEISTLENKFSQLYFIRSNWIIIQLNKS